MNERIKELAEKSGIRFTFLLSNPMIPAVNAEPADIGKFAELIVKECMSMCQTAVGNADYNTGRLHCLNNIKEHFGVE